MFKFLQKTLKLFFGIVVIGVVGLLVFYFTYNEKLPQGSDNATGDKISQEMQETLGIKAWNKTRYISWTTSNERYYIWDKKEGLAKVSWSGNEVLLNLNTGESIVKIKGVEISHLEKKEKLVYLARDYFEADKYWFSAPYEVFESDVQRSMVLLEGQSKRSLCIQYSDTHDSRSGEAYIYILDENNRPLTWKMWNDRFYLDGLSSDWIDWQKSSTGFWYPSSHKSQFFGYKIDIQNMLTGKRFKSIGLKTDPFKSLRKK